MAWPSYCHVVVTIINTHFIKPMPRHDIGFFFKNPIFGPKLSLVDISGKWVLQHVAIYYFDLEALYWLSVKILTFQTIHSVYGHILLISLYHSISDVITNFSLFFMARKTLLCMGLIRHTLSMSLTVPLTLTYTLLPFNLVMVG